MGITLIFKGKDWGGKSTYRKHPEEVIREKIERGSVTTADLHKIKKSGDRTLLKALEKKENEGLRKKKYVDDKYGKGIFDGVDNKGCPYKDLN